MVRPGRTGSCPSNIESAETAPIHMQIPPLIQLSESSIAPLHVTGILPAEIGPGNALRVRQQPGWRCDRANEQNQTTVFIHLGKHRIGLEGG